MVVGQCIQITRLQHAPNKGNEVSKLGLGLGLGLSWVWERFSKPTQILAKFHLGREPLFHEPDPISVELIKKSLFSSCHSRV